jgi:hypothetical protein
MMVKTAGGEVEQTEVEDWISGGSTTALGHVSPGASPGRGSVVL